jgi:HEXXH motif-containing protein
MSQRVETLLREGRQAAHDRLKVLKYVMLADDLRERGGAAAAAAQQLEDELAPLADLSLEDLAASGTPFFWLNIHRLYDRRHEDAAALAPVCDFLAAQAFDSYFGGLPRDASLALRGTGRDHLLPRLGLRVPAQAAGVRLRKLGEETVAVETGGARTTLELPELPAEWRLPVLPIAGEPSLLLRVASLELCDAEYLPLLAPDTPLAAALAAVLGSSLAVIRLVDAGVADRMRSLIGFYVPLATPEPKNHHSFSLSRQIGVIYLSEAYHDLRLAEALIHEYHHNELYLLMEVEPLLEERPGELFYSPWRADPRPLTGLLHALHVFTGVVDFYRRAEAVGALRAHHEEFRARRRELCPQLRLGLLQVPQERLTALGREVVAGMAQELAEHEADLGTPGPELPTPLQEHLRTWRQSHPALAATPRTS